MSRYHSMFSSLAAAICRKSTPRDSARTSTRSLIRRCNLMTQGILDTSTLILLGRLTDTDALPDEPIITTVTLAELSVGPLVASTADERTARQAYVQQAEADFDPLPFDTAAARSFGRVVASLHQSGRKPAARTYDAMIAAIAMSADIPIHTCNPRDFAGIDGLTVIAVTQPDH